MTDNAVLIERAQSGEKEAREILIEQNLGLVHHIIKRFAGRGVEMEDLFQIGTIGLMKSIDKFDFQYNVKFSTYAVPLITGEIKRFIRDDGMIKISRTVKENGMKMNIVREKIRREQNREPTIKEIAKETELTVDEVMLAMEANTQVESIYRSVYQQDGKEVLLVDQLISPNSHEEETAMNRVIVSQLLENLSEMEKRLIQLRYFENKTQTVVAKELGINQVQVSRMEKKILIHLRKILGEG